MTLSHDLIQISEDLKLGEYGHIANERFVKTSEHVLCLLHSINKNNFSISEIGPGPVLVLLKQKFPKFEYTSFQSPNERVWIEKLAPYSISISEWDLNQPLEKTNREKFDLILLLEVLEHLNRWPEFVLDDVYRLLKPGGTLVLTTPNLHRISNRARMVMGREPADPFKFTPTGEHHVREYSEMELFAFLSSANFKDIDVQCWATKNGFIGQLQRVLVKCMPNLFSDLLFAVARR